MAKKRDLICMTLQEQQSFTDTQKGVQVATNGHDGITAEMLADSLRAMAPKKTAIRL